MNTQPGIELRVLALAATLAVSVSGPAIAQSGSRQVPQRSMQKQSMQKQSMMQKTGAMEKSMMKTPVGLEGYCPVCIIDARKWEKGDPRIRSTFDGVAYYFPSSAIKAKFDRTPERYVPALNGDCIVCLEKAGKRVPGNIRHASLHNRRLYLFPSDKEKQMFGQNPKAYDNTDIGANGECIVCLVKANKHVPGSQQHTVFHNGLRYQFPSAREADMFRTNPEQFVSASMTMKDKPQEMIKTRMLKESNKALTVSGRSGCAACEFGVTPVGSPDELGLAIVGRDGQITVVENAHKSYPQIYQDRFQGQTLVAQGEIVKQQGNITWLNPSSLRLAR